LVGRAKVRVAAGGGVLVTTGVFTTLCGGRATAADPAGRAMIACARGMGVACVVTWAEAMALGGTLTAARATDRD